jgi:hypothetical protein
MGFLHTLICNIEFPGQQLVTPVLNNAENNPQLSAACNLLISHLLYKNNKVCQGIIFVKQIRVQT